MKLSDFAINLKIHKAYVAFFFLICILNEIIYTLNFIEFMPLWFIPYSLDFLHRIITSLANKNINFKVNYFGETEYNLELFKKPQ